MPVTAAQLYAARHDEDGSFYVNERELNYVRYTWALTWPLYTARGVFDKLQQIIKCCRRCCSVGVVLWLASPSPICYVRRYVHCMCMIVNPRFPAISTRCCTALGYVPLYHCLLLSKQRAVYTGYPSKCRVCIDYCLGRPIPMYSV